MNLKLIALFFASGVMQTHGSRPSRPYSAVNPDRPSVLAPVILGDLYPTCNVNPTCYATSDCSDFFACTRTLNEDEVKNELCPGYCDESDDWKWNPSSPNGRINPNGRKLDESDILVSLSSSCVDTFYKISIKTIGEYGHIGVLAEPSCKDADNIKACVDCPSYVFHANLDAEHPDLLQKIVEEVVVVVDDKENDKPNIHHEIEHLYELHKLLGAFEDVELDDNELYNLMYNNCGTFLIKMAHNLGIDPTDPDIISSVATMLSPTTKVGAVIGGSKYMARFIGNYVHAN